MAEGGTRNKVSYPGEGFWSAEKDGLHLIGSHCTKCGQNYFPPREICPECFAKGVEAKMEPIQLSSRGKLYSYSIVHVAPKRFNPPYGIGYVDFPEKVRVLGQLTTCDPKQLKVDMEVQAELGRIAVDEQGNEVQSYKFRPIG
jgi:uncharacterized OB-fold protein